tara:strand:- start:12154 stop:12765 length:612 start_codon:yes stop_codon:yes gene_type:complete
MGKVAAPYIDAANQQAFINKVGDFSMAMTIGGGLTSAIGAYYGVVNAQNQLKSQALSLKFAGQTAELNANLTEQQIAKVREASETQIGLSNMRYAEDIANARLSAAGRNVKVNQGSAAEKQRALRLMKEIDAMRIRVNAAGQMASLEIGAADQRANSLLNQVSAGNVAKTAKSMSPGSAFMSTAVGSAGRVAGMYYERFGGIA